MQKGPLSLRFKWWPLRRLVQIIALIVFVAPLLVAGWGLFGLFFGRDDALVTPANFPFFGSLSSSSVGGLTLLDPFALLQLIAASKSFPLNCIFSALPILLFYGLLRGRIFCGWICPTNFLLEGVDALRQKLGISVKESRLPRHAKLYVALGVVIISALTSVPVFEAYSPISAINKGILLGSTAGLGTLFAILVLELIWGHRFWCRSLCPVGGLYEALGRLGMVAIKIDHKVCTRCNACKQSCLADPIILDSALSGKDALVRAGDCMACGRCVDVCPTQALRLGWRHSTAKHSNIRTENSDTEKTATKKWKLS